MQTIPVVAPPIIPAWVRVSHWINVLAVAVMLFSGLKIYNASPIFEFLFPRWATLGGWLGGALLWHFAAMWLLTANLIVYIGLNIFSGRIVRRFLPLTPSSVIRDLLKFLKGKLLHDEPGILNAPQKFAYLFAIGVLCVLILSGLAIWKPVQLPLLREAFGGFDQARVVHFVAMSLLTGFILIHVAMVALVPSTLALMIKGR